MTKKYILTKDQIQTTVGTSDYPASSTAVKGELDKKLNIALGSSAANKILKTDADGNVTTGDAGTQLHFEIFTTLPTASSTYSQTLALIAMTSGGVEQNQYKEYACVKTSDSPETWAWELLGSVEATVDQTKDKIEVNGVALLFASYTDATTYQCGIISGADYNTFKNKQAQIPAGTSGQVVTYSGTAGTVGALGFDTAPTASSTNLVNSGAIKTALDAKVDEVEGTVAIGKDSTGYYFNE